MTLSEIRFINYIFSLQDMFVTLFKELQKLSC